METDRFLDEKRLRAAFAEFDLDGSGSISVDELKQVFAGCTHDGKVDEEMIDAILEQVDTNGDGEIDFEEFQDLMCITASQPSKEALRSWTTYTRAKSMKQLGSARKLVPPSSSFKGLRRFMSLKIDSGAVMTEKDPNDPPMLAPALEDFSSSFLTTSSSDEEETSSTPSAQDETTSPHIVASAWA